MKKRRIIRKPEIPTVVRLWAGPMVPREISGFFNFRKERFIMTGFEKLEFISEVLGSVKGPLELGEGARRGFHAILDEINDEIAGLRGSTDEGIGRG